MSTEKILSIVNTAIVLIVLLFMVFYEKPSEVIMDTSGYDMLKQEYDKQIKVANDSIAMLKEQLEMNNKSIDSLKLKKNEKITIIRRSLNSNSDINDFLSNRYKDRK